MQVHRSVCGVTSSRMAGSPAWAPFHLESRPGWVWICPEALGHLFPALGAARAGVGEDSQRAIGGGGAP